MTNEAHRPTLPQWISTVVIGRHPQWTLVRIVALVIVCIILFRFILLPIRVEGSSMFPTYQTGHIGFVNRLAYRSHEPERGDVVSIRFAGNSVMLMKRIVGLPGETVAFKDGKLYINDQYHEEPYVKSYCHWEMDSRQLGPGEFFVVGDNRAMSIDEHEHGIASRNRIVGKVIL